MEEWIVGNMQQERGHEEVIGPKEQNTLLQCIKLSIFNFKKISNDKPDIYEVVCVCVCRENSEESHVRI